MERSWWKVLGVVEPVADLDNIPMKFNVGTRGIVSDMHESQAFAV
jgi:hypothetical protein